VRCADVWNKARCSKVERGAREQRAESREQRAEHREQSTEHRKKRAESRKERAENREQSAKSRPRVERRDETIKKGVGHSMYWNRARGSKGI
jgi:hypothetical protein